MGTGRAGIANGRVNSLVAAVVGAAYWAAAAACLACVACGTATGTGAGRASAVLGRAKGSVAAVVSVACQRTRTAGCGGGKDGLTSRGREEGRSEVEAKVHVLAQEVQCLVQGEPEGTAGGRV